MLFRLQFYLIFCNLHFLLFLLDFPLVSFLILTQLEVVLIKTCDTNYWIIEKKIKFKNLHRSV